MKHTVSLKKPHEFRRLYSQGGVAAGAFVVVYSRQNTRQNNADRNYLGITVSSKIGGAVTRNRIRRRIREAYRAVEPDIIKITAIGRSFVIVAKKEAEEAEFGQLKREILKLTQKSAMRQAAQKRAK